MNLKACIIGATGLVGSQLVRLLLDDNNFERVLVFSRSTTTFKHPKLEEKIVDFENIADWEDQIVGNVLFSTLGTTLKTAGSKEKQYLVDYTFQYMVAKAASKNGIRNYVLVSSAGANANSKLFYSRIKGELEDDISKLNFTKITILRPSILTGNRKEKRITESISLTISRWLTQYLFKKYRPIKDHIVAQAMINSVTYEGIKEGHFVYELDEIFKLAEE
ncbi:NAD(P)H-binding protein [Sunxiuqinia sp. A32]|uniref:NAD(P)H-binding protein n=1 Tax=Sunxiuqinia sp. A32 TaxID=3461496 RepID=UPI0040457658